jgi:hypothetical protein
MKKCAVKGAGLQRVDSRLETGSLHPIAIETATEATKLSELSMGRVARRLSERAGHNVSERCAGPETIIAGADLTFSQGRPLTMETHGRTNFIGPAGVVAMACRQRRPDATREAPAVIAVVINWQLARDRLGRVGWRRGLLRSYDDASGSRAEAHS